MVKFGPILRSKYAQKSDQLDIGLMFERYSVHA